MARAVDDAATIAKALMYMPNGMDKGKAIEALSELLLKAINFEVREATYEEVNTDTES